MDNHRQKAFFPVLFLLILLCGSVSAQTPADYGRTWQDLPVLPEFNDHARHILSFTYVAYIQEVIVAIWYFCEIFF